MNPEEAQRWLTELTEKGTIPQLHIRRALETIADMDVETVVAESHPRGSWNGDSADPYYFNASPGTTMSRYVTEWEKA